MAKTLTGRDDKMDALGKWRARGEERRAAPSRVRCAWPLQAKESTAAALTWCCQHDLIRWRIARGQLLGIGGLALSTPTAMMTWRCLKRAGNSTSRNESSDTTQMPLLHSGARLHGREPLPRFLARDHLPEKDAERVLVAFLAHRAGEEQLWRRTQQHTQLCHTDLPDHIRRMDILT